MKHWIQRAPFFLLIVLGSAVPAVSKSPEIWTGIVVIADGQVAGDWVSAAPVWPPDDQWERWEQMEKMSRPEELRRLAPPTAILMPDTSGRSVLAVAPHAGLKKYVVDAGAGMVDLRGAEVEQCMVRLGAGGQVMAKDSLLSSFHVAESAGAQAGGSIILERCAVTGSFGGVFWGGSQRWVVRDCHFKASLLPWINPRALQIPVVENCHFEQCFIPQSFLLKCRNCTFDGCVVGGPDSFSAGGKPFFMTETGAPNRLPERRTGTAGISVSKGQPRALFWGAWRQDGPGDLLESRMASRYTVRPQMLSEGAETVVPQAMAAELKGKVYRRMDAGERLQFDGTAVNVLEAGQPQGGGGILSATGRQIEWTQPVRDFESDNGFGQMVRTGGTLKRKGLFSGNCELLAVVEEVPGSAPDPVRIFKVLPEAMAITRELVSQVAGTTWALEGPEKFSVRFETPTQLVWLAGAGQTRGGSQWRALQAEDELMVADWQGAPARVKLERGLQKLTLTSGTKKWAGSFTRRDQPDDFSPLMPAPMAKAVPQVVAKGETPEAANDNPFEPGQAVEAEAKQSSPPPLAGELLKSRTSRVNGLLVAVLEGGQTAGATSQMNVIAIPLAGGNETTLNFNQKIGPLMQKALDEVRKFQTIRQGRWPDGFQIEVSFADKYTPKDGPSAAVACALLLEGLYTGKVWDSELAVTGDLNADGSVQPVGGVPAKIKGAVSRKCRVVAIPDANERAVRDYFLSEGPQSLMGINVFTIKEFDHARDLAMLVKPPALTTALLEFAKVIQAAPPKDKAGPWLKQAAVTAQLRKVVQAAPTHLSAKLLLEYAEGRAPTVLSLTGSIEAIDRESFEVLQAIRSSRTGGSFSGIRQDKLGDAIYRLRRMRTQLHPGTRRLLDSMESFSSIIRTFLGNPPRTAAFINKAVEGIRAAGNTVDQQYQALRNNPEVMAELMKE